MSDRLLTTAQFGAALNPPVSKMTILRWINAGLIPQAQNKSLTGRHTWVIPESAVAVVEALRISQGQSFRETPQS